MHRIFFVSLLAASIAPLGCWAGDSVTMQRMIPFADDAIVPIAVKNQCHLPEKTATFVQQWAQKGMDVKMENTVSSKMRGKVLVMKITAVSGAGGGAWSGAKSITTKGTLYDNGKAIGSFTAARYSGGGFFGAYKGTCSILGRCAKALGKDIGIWMQAPRMNAHLGDVH